VWISKKTDYSNFELDEIYTFLERKSRTEEGENTYICTIISRYPRQIVKFDVDNHRTAEMIQGMVDSVNAAETYHTDGLKTYADVDYPGRHNQNSEDKSDTHNVESINADLRHHIPGLRRRSRCFYRSKETLVSVLYVFIEAYNKFGTAKLKWRKPIKHKSAYPDKHLHEWKDLPFSVLDFL
jgi:IS1 family transposase